MRWVARIAICLAMFVCAIRSLFIQAGQCRSPTIGCRPPHNVWDHHTDINSALPSICGQTDVPSAGLIVDLKQRSLLDETLVVWTGEFGGLPTS